MKKKKPTPRKTKPAAKKKAARVATATKKKPRKKSTPKSTKKVKPKSVGDVAYESHREGMAAASRARSIKGREIGQIPDIADPDRREKCKDSLKLFCETYMRKTFHLGWSDDHIRAIDRIEETVSKGALFAYAMDRGKGKTALSRAAVVWAISYRLRWYVFKIGATAEKAEESLDSIRIIMRFGAEYAADFPEISYPVQCLRGIAQRASGQLCQDESTLIEWAADSLVLATVPPPANWPKHWPLRADGKVPTSGSIIYAAGLTGEGIRGSLRTLSDTSMVRPDFVILDDPQTPESAASPTQNDKRLKLIMADVLGLAGPGEKIAAVMPCTVIEPGDMVDQVLDRTKHPLWRGERSGILRSMPIDLTAWDRYFEVYDRCAQLEPPDFAESNAYYVDRRAELDAGAEASWDERFNEDEVSAIQSAMHLYHRDRRAFWAEYQNQPLATNTAAANALDPDQVAGRVTNLAVRVVPRDATRLTAFFDVGVHLLWYAAVAWNERFGGVVISYGAYPDQHRSYFAANDARPALGDLAESQGKPQDAVIFAGLSAMAGAILAPAYKQEATGAELRIERCLVDANWGPGTDTVYDWCRRSPFANILQPSHGKFIGASSNPMGSWPVKPGERPGWHWRLSAPESGRGRHITFDTNHWKTFLADRLRTPEGAAGCLLLHDPGKGNHRMLGEHCAAEYPVAVKRQSGGREVEEWKDRPNRDNHLWDCLIGCSVAASLQGLTWSAGSAAGEGPVPQKKRKKVSALDQWKAARGIK